jgi:hypothetical protein
MWQDPIVKEVRKAGEELAKKNHYNLQDLLQNLRDNERKSKARIASRSKEKKLRKAG